MKRLQHHGHVNPAWRVCVCVCVCTDQQWRSRKINITMKVKMLVTQSCPTPWDPMDHSLLLCPRNFPGRNIGAGCYFLLQGIFSNHHISWGSCTGRQVLYQLSHQGSPCLPMPNLNTIMKKHQPTQVEEQQLTFKSMVKVTEQLRNCCRLKEAKETWWGKAKHDSGLGASAIKDVIRIAAK